MAKSVLMFALLIVAVLYLLDAVEQGWFATKPATNSAPISISTALTNANARLAISNALLRVQREIRLATNYDEIQALQLMEKSLTNALGR